MKKSAQEILPKHFFSFFNITSIDRPGFITPQQLIEIAWALCLQHVIDLSI
jgi:hypothetical protein